MQPTKQTGDFVAAAGLAMADPSPQRAMRSLLEETVQALHGRPRRWVEHEGGEMVVLSSAQLTIR